MVALLKTQIIFVFVNKENKCAINRLRYFQGVYGIKDRKQVIFEEEKKYLLI